jgi:hypothetical protein
MNHRNLITILLMVATVFTVAAQQKVTIRLVTGEAAVAVPGAHIYDAGGEVIATSKADGKVVLSAGSEPMMIRISHVSFMDTAIRITPSGATETIVLTPRVNHLKPYAVFGAPVNLIPDKPWFVSSYLHCDEGLLLLAYPQKKLTRQSLFLLDENQDVLSATPWKEQGTLVRDAAGGVWLRGKETTWFVAASKHRIVVGQESMPTKEFDAGIARIEVIRNEQYYFGFYKFDNQWLEYYCYDDREKQTAGFDTIIDLLGMKLRETRDIFETNEFERRFGEMCFFAPVYAPIAKQGEEILMFNYEDGSISVFDTLNHRVLQVPVAYHRHKSFERMLLHDRAEGRFYAVFETKGIYTVKEINIHTGALVNEIMIPSFPFIDQITVHNGAIYFLYNEIQQAEYKKIFRLKIPVDRIAQK